jgi:phenylalanyl-tRNA synthetase beta chain
MLISYNWLKDYINIDLPANQVGDILTDLGLELEGQKIYESIPGMLKGIVIGKVLECWKHPNADKLSLTKVDIGESELVQIVCGAPNVAEGQSVVVATPGAKLFPSEGESFTIKKGKIRGELSNGMICAEDELSLGDDHSGIIVLDGDYQPGTPAAEIYSPETDHIFEIGLTPNRADATSHLGVADDLLAYLRIHEGYEGTINRPDTSGFSVDNNNLQINVKVENEKGCPRYSGVSISGITIGPSPLWLQKRLDSIGVRPINNVVDITNFILHEYGQPLHAFDSDKIGKKEIIVKNLATGTPFLSLDEVERKLDDQDVMICDGNENGMCIGGVFGGISSGVVDQTTSIFLEAAHFDAKSIRRTSTRHLLRTDAAMRFEKGSDPEGTVEALKRAAVMIKELAGGVISSEIVDIYPKPVAKKKIKVRPQRVNSVIGHNLPNDRIHDILNAMNIETIEDKGTIVSVIPTNKPDVLREIDVIEEILRVHGFNNVPFVDKMNVGMTVSDYPSKSDLRDKLSNILVAKGFHQAMGMSITQSKYFEGLDSSNFVFINNTSNSHLDIMRPGMLVTALEMVHHNQNRRNLDIKFFEFGRSYLKQENSFVEKEHMVLTMKGRRVPENWQIKEKESVDLYTIKSVVENTLNMLGIKIDQWVESNDVRFAYGLSGISNTKELVNFGLVSPDWLSRFDIKDSLFFADFDFELLHKKNKAAKIIVKELNKYPTVRRDLALVIDESIQFSDLKKTIEKTERKILSKVELFDVYKNKETIGEGKKSYAISLTFEEFTKTLKDKEVDKSVRKIINALSQQNGAMVR